MTPAQAAWLQKLRDEGPQKNRFSPLSEYRQAVDSGWFELARRDFRYRITSSGLAALAEYEEKVK